MATKKEREIIFNKYDGKCAYCGDPLKKGWHVDEFLPVKRLRSFKKDGNGDRIWKNGKYLEETIILHPENFNIDNQMPSCPSCNINKHSGSIEEFRSLITGFMKHLNEINTQYKIAKRYGLVKEDIKPIIFHFEKIDREVDNDRH